jgi:hypothetical protein
LLCHSSVAGVARIDRDAGRATLSAGDHQEAAMKTIATLGLFLAATIAWPALADGDTANELKQLARPGPEGSPNLSERGVVIDYTTAGAFRCSDLTGAGSQEIGSIVFDPIVEYVTKRGGFKDGYGSACNIYDFVLAVCRVYPSARVSQAVNELFSRKTRGLEMPTIPQCGA